MQNDIVRQVQAVLDPYLRDGLDGGRTLPPTAKSVMDSLRALGIAVVSAESIVERLKPVYGFATAHRVAGLLLERDVPIQEHYTVG